MPDKRFQISLIMAMQGEANGIIDALGLQPFHPHDRYGELQLRFYRGLYRDLDITLTLPGKDPRYGIDSIGTEPAAVAAFASVMEFKPDLIINAGTCGSFAEHGAKIAKVYLSDTGFFFHDRRIPVLKWDQYARGNYRSLDVSALAERLNLSKANVSSGNSLDHTEAELRSITENAAILKEMEAAAIGWVAFITKTPMFAVKSVTDLIDVHADTAEQFRENFAEAVAQLSITVKSVIDALAQTDLVESLKTNRL